MVNYVCHSENSNSSKANAGAGSGEEDGGSNDLWFGSHAYSADFTNHHSYLNSQNRPLGTQPREKERKGQSYDITQLRVICVLGQPFVQVLPLPPILQTVFTVLKMSMLICTQHDLYSVQTYNTATCSLSTVSFSSSLLVFIQSNL